MSIWLAKLKKEVTRIVPDTDVKFNSGTKGKSLFLLWNFFFSKKDVLSTPLIVETMRLPPLATPVCLVKHLLKLIVGHARTKFLGMSLRL